MSRIFSQHHFIFPFRWDVLNKGFKTGDIKENIPFDERTDLLGGIPDNFGNWSRKMFTLKDQQDKLNNQAYNEFTYFHEFATRALFDFEHPFRKNQSIIKYYEYKIDEYLQNKYCIEYFEEGSIQLIDLDIKGITLHFFNTGVGVLSFNLNNTKEIQHNEKTILKINEYGRRIYPQFLGDKGLQNTKESFLANKITLTVNSQIIADEDFSWYELFNNNPTVAEPFRLPSFITNLFPDYFIFNIAAILNERKVLISKVGDDRMFFQTWYENDKISEEIYKGFTIQENIKNDWLYSYIFGDKDKPNIANEIMKNDQLDKHTYKRWISNKVVYGMSKDSFVCITKENDFFSGIIRTHMNTMYYTLCVLCLVQRASVLKFTAEVTNLADLAKMDNDNKVLLNIKELYKNYIEFINKLYFREITPQIQGIEIYNQFQGILNLKDEIRDLDNEINELHQYASLIQDEKRNKEAGRLNMWAAIFLPATIVFGIYGSNFIDDKVDFSETIFSLSSLFWVVLGFIPSLIIFIIIYINKRK